MCGANLIPALIGSAILGVGMTQLNKTPTINASDFQTYTPEAAPAPTQGVEAPVATPVMTTQGQEQAQDEQKATEQRVRRNRLGRNILRIDRTLPNNSGLGAGSGVNVPGG